MTIRRRAQWPVLSLPARGASVIARGALAEQPGTYVLTDFLARTVQHTALRELALDRHPELRDAYFSNYTRALEALVA